MVDVSTGALPAPTSVVIDEIERFLTDDKSRVICIHGKWGVGKTHTWVSAVKQTRDKGKLVNSRYAYVSLFGLQNLDQLRYSIFENSLNANQIDDEPTLASFKANTFSFVERLGKSAVDTVAKNPFVSKYVGNLERAAFLTVRNQIVCIDDLERRGKDLRIIDVLGLVSFLKDHRKCKVAIILNDEELNPQDKQDFERYHEKVIESALLFDPPAAECLAIGLQPDSLINARLSFVCSQLGLSNIRVIRRIREYALRAQELLKDYNEHIIDRALTSIAIFGWALFSQPDKSESPTAIDFVLQKRGRGIYGATKQENLAPNEREWERKLDLCAFKRADEFDLVVHTGISSGYFDQEKLKKEADRIAEALKAHEVYAAWNAAWEKLQNSFDDNEGELVDELVAAFRMMKPNLGVMDLDQFIRLLKHLGRPELAKSLLDEFMKTNLNREYFELERSVSNPEALDPDVSREFNAKYVAMRPQRSLSEILLHIYFHNSWSTDDIQQLTEAKADDFFNLFSSTKGEDLPRMVKASVNFGRISPPEPRYTSIAFEATQGLRQLGLQNRLNRRRVQAFGVEVEESPSGS